MCQMCSEVYLNLCLSEPNLNLPLKCKCGDDYEFETVEKISIFFKIDKKLDKLLTKHSLATNKEEGKLFEFKIFI